VCGRVSRIARRASHSSPQVGICCYRLPLATCTDCRRERPCYWAKTGEPVCPKCTAARRPELCVGCGQRRVAHRRVDGGILCQACDIKHGYTTRACEGCGQVAPLLRGVCAACQLRARVDELAAGAGPGIAGTLAPFLGDLTRAANPRSMLRWFCCPGFGITRGLLAGEIPISHAGLDEAAVGAANAVAFVRAKLVISGVLEPRDEASAAIRSLARHGGATARARCRSCACAGLREVAGRASARADRQEARRGHARLGEVRPGRS
jgi:hypothetical protein